jgi:hypothetical protein
VTGAEKEDTALFDTSALRSVVSEVLRLRLARTGSAGRPLSL